MRPTQLVAACGMTLALAGFAGVGAAARAGDSAGAAREVGGFLARQLDAYDGLLPYPGTDQVDAGLTIDAVLGMLATGVGPDQARAATRALAPELGRYLGPGIAPTELYAGPVAKALLLATAVGSDPQAFGGHDLVADLAGLDGGDGHYGDRTAYGDASNTFTQALGILATTRVAGAAPERPVRFLLAQQCADGGFRLYVREGDCVSDPDPTALAIVALRGAPGQEAAAQRALTYLAGRMDAGGGIAGGAGAATPNSNTTGLAAMAFAVSGPPWVDATQRAQGFLRSLQFGCDASESLRGAVAYDANTYAAGPAPGAGDQERRASAQAALGLAGVAIGAVTIDGAEQPPTGCTGPTTPPTSTSSTTTSSASPGSSSTTSTTGGGSVPATVTITRPGVTTTAYSTRTVTAPAATITRTITASSTPPPRPATAASIERTLDAPLPSTPSQQATAVAAVRTSGSGPGRPGGPLAIAGALVVLGAAGAGTILRRGRTH